MGAAPVALVVTAALSLMAVRCRWLRDRFTRRVEGPRWRSDPVPLAGGVAMVGGFTLAVALFGRAAEGAWPVLGAAGAAFLVGLADDLRPLPPAAKLAGQVGAGVVLAAAGVRLALPGPAAVAWVATVVWVVVAANAINLFDNVDAAAGGTALVAAVTLWLWWAVGSGPSVLAAALAGSAAGFMAFNFPPARLFMGDAGSHFLGVALAGLTVLDAGRAGSSGPAPIALVLFVPVALLAAPLFDTALVAVERARHGRSLMTGGRDHTSHRLLALGLGVLPVTAALWGAAVIAAGVASLAAAGWAWFTAGVVLLAAGLGVAGLRLARVPVYG